MAISKKAGGKKGGAASKPPPAKGGAPKKGGIAKADWREGFKKPQVGVSDMTLLSKVSNEAVNENLQKRFQNAEIYVRRGERVRAALRLTPPADVHRQRADLGEPVPGSGHLHRGDAGVVPRQEPP
jgi:hypothetical protein